MRVLLRWLSLMGVPMADQRKAERAPMGDPDAKQIAKAWFEAYGRVGSERGDWPRWSTKWESLTPAHREFLIAVVQDLIDAGHVL
jgi:hypothetical protein